MKNTLIISAVLSAGIANGATILATDFTGSGPAGAVTWDTQDASVSAVDSTLTNIGGPFGVLGDNSTNDDVTINDNLSDDTAKGFSFSFTLTGSVELSSFAIEAGHLNSSGGNQSFGSDLIFSLTQTAGGSYSFSDTKDDVDYGPGFPRRPQSFDLTGQTLGAGTYTLQLVMQDTDNGVGGAFASFDTLSLEGTVVPEPSSTALLGLGGLALILRRRK